MKFCGHCGSAFAISCPRCGSENLPENNFCGRCAEPLDRAQQDRPKDSTAMPSGELKRVSMLFCDLVDSTRMAERLGPEKMHELVRWFIDTALAAVNRYEGTVPQFSGDGFLGLFGAPIAREDHAERALLTALAIREIIAGGSGTERGWPKLEIRIGIHTGLVVFGPVGGNLRMDPTAIGDAANVAARLQTAAEPGTILISEETYRLVQAYAYVERCGPLSLKGKRAPVVAYRLLDFSHRLRTGAAPAARPFVDRTGEMALFETLVPAISEGRGRVLGLIGEAGIGKSRLVSEFRKRLPEALLWVEGRCISYRTMVPYQLVLDLLRRICGIVQVDAVDAVTAKLNAALKQAGMDPDQDGPLLLNILGVQNLSGRRAQSSPEAVKAKAFAALRQLIVGTSRDRPLALVLEDLHWLDKVSEEFLTFLGEVVSSTPMLVIATYRPGFRSPWIDKSYAGQVPLQPLSRADSLNLLRSVPARLDEPIMEAIVAKADGNPLFLEQLALDADEADEGRSVGTVPDTINDVIMARIDRLPDDTKRILQVASVIGRRFSLRLLRAVWQGAGPMEPHLAELVRLEFIQERFDAGRTTYVFRHALTQETAYASLLERYRRVLHGAAGAAIEAFVGDRIQEVADQLAFHFGRSDEAEKAVDYAILAAEKAQRRWASSEAVAYFKAALERLESMPDSEPNRLRRIDAVLKQGDVKFALGRHTEHIQDLDGIRDVVRDTGDPRRRASWHYWSGYLRSLTGKGLALAIDDCRESAAIAAAADLTEIVGYGNSSLAMAYSFAGRPLEAIEVGEQALAIFEAGGNRLWASRTLWHLSLAANMLGEWETSLAYCHRALAHGVAVDDRRLQAIGLWRMGSVHVQRGDPRSGIKCCDEALALAPPPYDVAHAKAVRGYGQIKMGRLDAGVTEMTEALSWFENFRLRQPSLRWALWLVEGYLLRGDVGRARSLTIDVLNESREAGYRHIEGSACWLISDCLGPDDPRAAEEYVEQAIRIFEAIGARNDLAKALATRAGLLWRAGDSVAARRLFGEARDIFAALRTRDEQAMVEDALGELDRGSALSRHHYVRSVRPPAGPQSAD
jgi:class 3 adenylate cyclase/tetratricopeptide (TPR) repeat protein